MRIASLFEPATSGLSTTLLCLWPLVSLVNAYSFTPVSEPELDLSSLGRISLVGDFDAASLYQYKEQSNTQTGNSNNGSQSLLTSLPNGFITNLSTADSQILAVCSLDINGTEPRIFVGGNFSSLGGVNSSGIALFEPNSTKVSPLPGLNGSVSALLCDQEADSVYVGGDFKYGNSSNAAIWKADKGLSRLPFGGFNGPVTSIMKGESGHIIFGGSFNGRGNSTKSKDKEQVINLQNATVSSATDASPGGYNNPRNIVCQSSGQDGPGKTWLLYDRSAGYWRAQMNYNFNPSKLRLYNTHLDGRGTKTFLFRALPDNGIMNLTYSDPNSGKEVSCDSACPLSDDKKEKHRDFKFVNNVGMRGFQIEFIDWYGDGAGLNGIELLQDDVVTYAINEYNEPACADVEYPGRATQRGPWTTSKTVPGHSDFLTARVADTDTSVTFEPDVKQSGNYSVLLYTPGCLQDGTCGSRGIVNVTGKFATSTEPSKPFQTSVYQTNNEEKYDTIYTGFIDASSDSFRPHVSLSRANGQGDITMVASRIKLDLKNATGGLNGLYEYDPKVANASISSFARSVVDRAGTQLEDNATVLALARHNGTIYAGGNFSGPDINNIMSFKDENATSLPQKGLDSEVNSMLVFQDSLYVGGNFTSPVDGKNDSLKHVAEYSFTSKNWSSLGGGVNGRVDSILAFPLNVSKDINETTIAISGDFDQVLGFNDTPSTAVSGFAVWVPSRRNWLQNLNVSYYGFDGQLSGIVPVNDTDILAGNLTSEGLASNGAVSLHYSDKLSLDPLSTRLQKNNGSGGIFAGYVDKSSGRNLTILGGHFSAISSNKSSVQNLLILDEKHNNATGLGPGVENNSTFVSLAVSNNTLYAGGNVTGSVGKSELNGLVLYDLSRGKLVDNQPYPLAGKDVYVNSIAPRPGSKQVYFGGNFEAAGSLPCPSVCIYDATEAKWTAPGVGLSGTVLSIRWASSEKLVVVGDLSVKKSRTAVATYNTKSQAWSSFDGASPSDIPGSVTAFTPASEDISNFWLAGKSPNGTSFVINYDGSKFQSAGELFGKETEIDGMEVLPTHKDHGSTRFLNRDLVLLLTGRLVIPKFGNASAALFNGTTVTPFILTSSSDGKPGKISQLFSEKKNTFNEKHGKHHHSNGIVVLISFCLALGCVFLIVIAGIIFNKVQRHRQGYVRAPQAYPTDRRPSAMTRLPPEYLFNSLRQPNPGAPTI